MRCLGNALRDVQAIGRAIYSRYFMTWISKLELQLLQDREEL